MDEEKYQNNKHQHEPENFDECCAKRLKSEDSKDTALANFLEWCQLNKIFIDYDKVTITREKTSHNYGMIAVQDLKSKQVLARIPKKILLQPKTASINELIKLKSDELKSDSNWSKLIVSVMHECCSSNSKWAPYLNLFPDYNNLDLPMFWDDSTLNNLLNYTCVVRNVRADLVKMRKEFDDIIVPFIQKNMEYFNEKCLSFDYYRQIVAFIMSYSFRDPEEDPGDSSSIGPMMVPVADILNAIAKNNAQLCFDKDELTLIATKPIKKGEEVFNTYGETSNTDLLHMYGYVETYPANIYDNLEIPTDCFIEAYKKLSNDSEGLREKKLEVFKELDFIDEHMSFEIGTEGILNEEECLHMLQIFSMKSDELKEFIENDYELLEDEEWDEFSLNNKNLTKLPIDWITFMHECCDLHLNNLKSSEKKLKNELDKHEIDLVSKTRASKSLALIEGHIAILSNVMRYLH